MRWFNDARFGLFVHYALASLVPGGKWEFLEKSESKDSFKETLFDRFRAERFDADEICDLALEAEMSYITFTTRHLGDMYMFDTEVSDFNSVNSPAGRDLVGELAEACRAKGLGLFFYVPPDASRTDEAHLEKNRTLLRELLSNYGPVAGIWFDGIGKFLNSPQKYGRLKEIYGLVRSLQPHCLISYKGGALCEEDFVTAEHYHPAARPPDGWNTKGRQKRWEHRMDRWQRRKKERGPRWWKFFHTVPIEINTTMQECYNRDARGRRGGWINDEDARHLDADGVMYLLRVARSADANLLMNIGPRGDGSVHPKDREALKETGRRIRASGFPGKDI